jgi:hypothetical protein
MIMRKKALEGTLSSGLGFKGVEYIDKSTFTYDPWPFETKSNYCKDCTYFILLDAK